MRFLQPETDNHGASLLQRGPDRSVRPQIHVCSPQIAAEHRQLAAGSEIIVPVAQEHHRHIGGSLLAADPVAPVPVHTEQHRLPDNFRRNLLPFKEVRQRVEHGRRAAVILGQLIMQRIFHRVRLISRLFYMNYRNPSFPCQYAFPGGPEPISVSVRTILRESHGSALPFRQWVLHRRDGTHPDCASSAPFDIPHVRGRVRFFV